MSKITWGLIGVGFIILGILLNDFGYEYGATCFVIAIVWYFAQPYITKD